ncbi:MAG: SpoIIE family protein phosphatase [Oscillospiraceae bacterium]
MAEKTAVRRLGLSMKSRAADDPRTNIVSCALFAAAGLLLELGGGSGAVSSSALAAAVFGCREPGTGAGGSAQRTAAWDYGAAGWCVCAGGITGALLHGFSAGLLGIGGIAIALAGRLIPRVKHLWLRCAVQGLIAAAASFFPACAEFTKPTELLSGIIAAVTAGIFTVCVMLLLDRAYVRGLDFADNGDCALAAAAIGIAFLTLGRLDYPPCNIGRLLAGLLMLLASDRRGAEFCTLPGIAAVAGLCASGSADITSAGVVCLAATLSCALARFGKITKAVGFVFFGCVGILVWGIMDGSWQVFAELAAAGAAYALIPARLVAAKDSERPDNTATLVIKERMGFAAGAVAGVNSSLEATADTLERRYSESLPQVADKAAEKCCRSCPNNMVCWGQKYELFHAEFNRLVKQLRSGGEITERSMSPNAAAECVDRAGVIRAVRKAYEQYLQASGEQQHIRELRRIYSAQLTSLSEILSDLGSSFGKLRTGSRRPAERRAEKVLRECGLTDPAAFVTFTKGGRMRLEAYGGGELKSEREYLGELLIRALGRELDLPEVSVSGGRVRVTASERAMLSAEIGACQLNRGKNRVCGDCLDSFTDPSGALYIVLSDGMGTGSRARIDSALACSMAVKLIKSGIPLSAALEAVNTSLMVKSADESFATLDICRIDLNTGECVIYKAGAATTYIRSGERLIRAALSSQPIGSGGRVTVPAQKFSVTAGDSLIMTTDGAMLDEEWLSRELSRENVAQTKPVSLAGTAAQELAERIARAARGAENGREDDISIIVVNIGR